LPSISGASKSAAAGESEGTAQNSEKKLNALEQQYEASRYLTHIARGAGLGYGSH